MSIALNGQPYAVAYGVVNEPVSLRRHAGLLMPVAWQSPRRTAKVVRSPGAIIAHPRLLQASPQSCQNGKPSATAVKRFAGRRWLTDSSHGLGQFSLRMGQMISAPWQSACVPRWWRAYGESDCACTSVNTRIMNASNSSSEWNRATWPDTRCSTRPSYQGDAPVGWGRNCTTKTRLVGSDG